MFVSAYFSILDGNNPKSHPNALLISRFWVPRLLPESKIQRERGFSPPRRASRASQKRGDFPPPTPDTPSVPSAPSPIERPAGATRRRRGTPAPPPRSSCCRAALPPCCCRAARPPLLLHPAVTPPPASPAAAPLAHARPATLADDLRRRNALSGLGKCHPQTRAFRFPTPEAGPAAEGCRRQRRTRRRSPRPRTTSALLPRRRPPLLPLRRG